jgi:hypothetical protein
MSKPKNQDAWLRLQLALAVRVVPDLAGVAVGLPVLHRGAGGLKALGITMT